MKIHEACLQIFEQLSKVVNDIEQVDFVRPCASLSNATIGQHIRHTLEFFTCFEEGYQNGVINYDKRSHDKLLESDKVLAMKALQKSVAFVKSLTDNYSLKLEVSYGQGSNICVLETNTMRELVYNIEHAVHHMAIIKIGIRETAPYIILDSNFGIADSTVRHKETSTVTAFR